MSWLSRGLKVTVKVMTFRAEKEDFMSFDREILLFGLLCTWVVGIGRWWDDPGAKLFQHLGIGSVAYVFVLSFVIWLLVKPLGPQNWSYRHVLTFVSLTALPALLYAIPVEQFWSLKIATILNVWFLAIVALWRVSVFFFYLKRHAGLHWFYTIVVGLLPLTAIVTSLYVLNLERVVFRVMGGLRDAEKTSNDSAYGILFLLTLFSMSAIIPLLICYMAMVCRTWQKRKKKGQLDRTENKN